MEDGHLLASMQAFINVVESGSFSESARRLGLSQPSVSRQVNTLESQLGVRLLQRTTRSLSLTEAGQIYYEKAKHIQRAVTEASQAISGFKDSPSGLLRISVPHTWAEAKIVPHLGEFLSLYPEIKLEIQCNDHIQDMVEERLDLVIRVGRANDSSYIAIPFSKVKIILCASPRYFEQQGRPKTIADLNNHNFITYDKFNKLVLSKEGDQQEIPMQGPLSMNTVAGIISAAKQGIGLIAVPDLLLNKDLKQNLLIQIMPDYHIDIKGLAVEQAFAMYSSRKQMPAKVRAFLDFYKVKFNH
ncbi:MAG: DNA-binding transcriptional LysR family regulator [Oleispira sp.]|jgi:DNA-binding transcriptional LysR family regulator